MEIVCSKLWIKKHKKQQQEENNRQAQSNTNCGQSLTVNLIPAVINIYS